MAQFSITITGLSLTTDQLSAADKALLQQAQLATQNAYAPYSRFYVGAALRLEEGTTVLGTNQENAAYPSGLCAERVALFAAATNYPNQVIDTIAICVQTDQTQLTTPLSPCGGCRQVIMEYQNKQQKPIRLLLASPNNKVWVFEDAAMLLPFGFEAQYLQKNKP